MKELVIATQNPNKAKEIRKILPPEIEVFTASEKGIHSSPEETENTLFGNALIKARHVHKQLNDPSILVMSDDSGLFVEALDGAPGVHSARFAGENASDEDNLNLLLDKLKGKIKRKATFKCRIVLLSSHDTQRFDGEVNGEIIEVPRGNQGFGYDPVFIPINYTQTFAELDSEIKNKISHRAVALEKFRNYFIKNLSKY